MIHKIDTTLDHREKAEKVMNTSVETCRILYLYSSDSLRKNSRGGSKLNRLRRTRVLFSYCWAQSLSRPVESANPAVLTHEMLSTSRALLLRNLALR
jgi:hypothetical protein